MGDRSNIVMTYDNSQEIWFYTHWRGSEVPAILRGALAFAKQSGRLDDDNYLASIVFCALVKDACDPVTGFGIGPCKTDWEYPALVVHIPSQEVEMRKLVWHDDEADHQIGRRVSIEEYLTLPEKCDYDAVTALVNKAA